MRPRFAVPYTEPTTRFTGVQRASVAQARPVVAVADTGRVSRWEGLADTLAVTGATRGSRAAHLRDTEGRSHV